MNMFAWMKNKNTKKQKWSLAQYTAAFFMVASALFLTIILIVLLPKIDQVIDDFRITKENIISSKYADKFKDYLVVREKILSDFAYHSMTPFIGSERTYGAKFEQLISQLRLMGEDPVITLIDDKKQVVSEANAFGASSFEAFEWVKPILENKTEQIVRIVDYDTEPKFDIAIDVVFNNGNEGVLIARLSAEPMNIFNDHFLKDVGVSYTKNDIKVATNNINTFQLPYTELHYILYYDITFGYTKEQLNEFEYKQLFLNTFFYTAILSFLAMFLVLFFIGRKIIIKPFNQLANLQEAISLAVEGISSIDTEGKYITLNEAYAGTAGYTPEELEGQPWSKTVYEKDLEALNQAYQVMIDEGKVVAEARGIKKDGTIFYKQVTMISQYNKSGEFIGHHCFLKDITDKKIADNLLARQQQELQLIFDNVPVSLIYKNDKNQILRINKTAAKTYGKEVHELEGKNIFDIYPEDAARIHQQELDIINTQKPLLNAVVECTFPDKAPVWIKTNKIPYKDPKDNQNFIFVCNEDITKEKEDEAKLKHLNDELAQFAYRTSHDLKSPLASISTITDFIIEDIDDENYDEAKSNCGLIQSQALKLSALVTDILELAKADTDSGEKTVIHFKPLISEILSELNVIFGELDISIQTDIEETTDFSCETVRMRQVLYNLLSNAIKYADPSKSDKYIKLNVITQHKKLIIVVEDNGLGIPEAFRQDTFKMFKRFHPNVASGSGLGLSIIKKHVEKIGGQIKLCEGNESTRFEMSFNVESKT